MGELHGFAGLNAHLWQAYGGGAVKGDALGRFGAAQVRLAVDALQVGLGVVHQAAAGRQFQGVAVDAGYAFAHGVHLLAAGQVGTHDHVQSAHDVGAPGAVAVVAG